MNKFLILGLGGVLLIGAGFLLLNQTSQTPTSSLVETEETQTVEPRPTDQAEVEGEMIGLTESGFTPRTLTIQAGSMVVFTNNTGRIATVDSDVHPTHRLYPILNKGNFGPGEKHEVTFEETGTFTYHNHLNSSQTGTVIIE